MAMTPSTSMLGVYVIGPPLVFGCIALSDWTGEQYLHSFGNEKSCPRSGVTFWSARPRWWMTWLVVGPPPPGPDSDSVSAVECCKEPCDGRCRRADPLSGSSFWAGPREFVDARSGGALDRR